MGGSDKVKHTPTLWPSNPTPKAMSVSIYTKTCTWMSLSTQGLVHEQVYPSTQELILIAVVLLSAQTRWLKHPSGGKWNIYTIRTVQVQTNLMKNES